MKEYIVGGYFRSKEQLEAIKNNPEQLILDNLKKSYPHAKTVTTLVKDLREENGIASGTIYKGITNLEKLHFVHKLSRRQKKDVALREKRKLNGRPEYYIIEQADNTMNSLSAHTDSSKRLPEYWLAPGYVEYDEEFSKGWNDLLVNRPIEELLHPILKHILQFLNVILEHNEIRKTVSSSGSSVRHCMNCGVDHETRNFLRAILLKVLDYAETSPDYIKFLRDNKILNNSGYEIYEEASKFFSTKETELKKNENSIQYYKLSSIPSSCCHSANTLS